MTINTTAHRTVQNIVPFGRNDNGSAAIRVLTTLNELPEHSGYCTHRTASSCTVDTCSSILRTNSVQLSASTKLTARSLYWSRIRTPEVVMLLN